MNWLDNFENIKVEVTSYCNAKCPGCTRNITGGAVVPQLELNHMPYKLWHRIMHEDTQGMHLAEVLFDGNVGDLCMHPEAHQLVKTTIDAHPETHISVNTNGGARNEAFWEEMGSIVKDVPHRFNFAIDGLEDTHAIHRRSTNYDIIIRNMRAFLKGGGQANWVYTIFDHNTHQIRDAHYRAVANDCHWFQTRWSCIPGSDLYTKTDKEEYEIGTETIYDHEEEFHVLRNIIPHQEPEDAGHKCNAFNEKQIQIDFRGILWPCSYIYSTEVYNNDPLDSSPFIRDIKHPGSSLSLYNHKLKDILNNEFFTTQLPKAIEDEQLEICNKWCFNN